MTRTVIIADVFGRARLVGVSSKSVSALVDIARKSVMRDSAQADTVQRADREQSFQNV